MNSIDGNDGEIEVMLRLRCLHRCGMGNWGLLLLMSIDGNGNGRMVVLLVSPQTSSITVRLLAAFHITLVGLLVAMGEHVSVQVILTFEGLAA